MARHRLGFWDCTSCDTAKVRGNVYSCPGCGAGRPPGVKFYLAEDSPWIEDEAEVQAAEAGADWRCEYCDAWVPATRSSCPSCAGGELAGAERQAVRVVGAEPPPAAAAPARMPLGRCALGCLLLALLLGGCLAALGWLGRPREVVVAVTGHSWTRTQEVEELRVGMAGEGWDRPADAYDVTSERRVHHHEQVLDRHETRTRTGTRRVESGREPVYEERTVDLGNGRFRTEQVQTGTRPVYRTETYTETYQEPIYRQEPVHATWYRYRVDRWVAVAPRVARGADRECAWPSDRVERDGQRMGPRSERYTLHLREVTTREGQAPRVRAHELPEARWRALEPGQELVAVVQGDELRELLTAAEAAARQER